MNRVRDLPVRDALQPDRCFSNGAHVRDGVRGRLRTSIVGPGKAARLAALARRIRITVVVDSVRGLGEIVSDSSVRKDKVELRQSYFAAGIPEYWLIDARGDELDFQLLVRGTEDYVAQSADAKGYFWSPCFGRRFLLTRKAHKISGWSYRLLTRAE